jgi:hypothetical protein
MQTATEDQDQGMWEHNFFTSARVRANSLHTNSDFFAVVLVSAIQS